MWIKKLYVKITFWLLSRSLKVVHKIDKEVEKFWSKIENSNSFAFIIEPKGPCLVVKREGEKIITTTSCKEQADILFIFKTINSAFSVFSAQKPTIRAYAENRILIKGDIGDIMWVMRIMDRVQFYLFPRFIAKRVIKKFPDWGLGKTLLKKFTFACRFVLG